MAGPLFRELAEDLSERWSPCLLYTGHPDTIRWSQGGNLYVKEAPVYDRQNYLTRFFSWIHYFFRAIRLLATQQKHTMIFIVSNPPFLGLAGLIFQLIKRMRYVILVYDVYPDILVCMGKIKNRFFAACWDVFNRIIYKHASLVLTIDKDMSKMLEKRLRVSCNNGQGVFAIYPWADISNIKPMQKDRNWFVENHNLKYETIVLYSGNMGHTHPIEPLLHAATELGSSPDIHFLFIGEGEKYSLVEQHIKTYKLQNITLLPFQPEEVLPYSMAAGDIGIVAYENGSQGCMLPSKTFYYMAAGLTPLIISHRETHFSNLIEKMACGTRVGMLSGSELANVIQGFHSDRQRLEHFKKNSRAVAVQLFSRKNTVQFEKVLLEIGI